MGKLKGFLEFEREDESVIEPKSRLENFKEFTVSPKKEELENQGARCMDCGVPFCHSGCPLGNLIPDFNDSVYKNDWKKALETLHATNNFPEFTGRLCPAPCEDACVLGIIEPPVSIEMIEKYIVERGFKEGWIKPNKPTSRTGKKIAIVGSGPAGLAAAQQLNKAGHLVTVYERDEKVGGLLRYGIPDFKLEKNIIDRRIEQLIGEGIIFKTNTSIGKDILVTDLEAENDAVLLCVGSTIRRNLPMKGADLEGVIQAMDYLPYNNKRVEDKQPHEEKFNAKGKDVIVIGGGDTGSDCIGTSNRLGAKSVTNFEIMPKPSAERVEEYPWPYWSFRLKSSSSHKEGVHREWEIMTKEFIGDEKGKITGLKTVEVKWEKSFGKPNKLVEVEGSEKIWPCDMALLALGFTGPEQEVVQQLDLPLTERNNIDTAKDYQTQNSKVFVAGDARRGQSLIVWAISEGREAAYQIDHFLTGKSKLPTKGKFGDLPSV